MERDGLFHGRVDGCLGQGEATPPGIHGTGIPKSVWREAAGRQTSGAER